MASRRPRPGDAGLWRRRTYTLAALLGLATLALTLLVLRPQAPPPAAVARFALDVESTGLIAERFPKVIPDGSGVVFRGTDPSSRAPMLLVRRWSELRPLPIPGTEGALEFEVSPNGEEVAFVVRRGDDFPLLVSSMRGGVVRTLIGSMRTGFTWAPDGYIYLMARGAEGIDRLRPDAPNETASVTMLAEGEARHGDFRPWPEADVGVFTVVAGEELRVDAVRLSTGERRTLTPGATPFLTESGHIVFGSGTGEIMAAAFDHRAMELRGAPVPIIEGVAQRGGVPAYSLSAEGTLVYMGSGLTAAERDREFVWVTRDGAVTRVDPGNGFQPAFRDPSFRLSPDGNRVAFSRLVDGNDDIWIKELPDGEPSRLTFDTARDNRAQWSADGERIVFRSGRGIESDLETTHIWTKRADGSGTAELLFDDFHAALGMWSPDGEWLIVRRGALNNAGGRDIHGLRWGVDSVAVPLVAEEGIGEQAPAISRDGRWMAYSSNESGRFEIYVRPFPNVADGRWQVSDQGGELPVWAHGGNELFFVNPATRELMSAEFTTTQTAFERRGVATLFEIPLEIYVAPGNAGSYDVAPGDERFLMAQLMGAADDFRYILVQNFLEELKRLVPS